MDCRDILPIQSWSPEDEAKWLWDQQVKVSKYRKLPALFFSVSQRAFTPCIYLICLVHPSFVPSVSSVSLSLIHSLSPLHYLSLHLSLTLSLSVCLSTAAGSCLLVPLGYRWCNQTGQSHRLALTLADTNQKRRDREKERKKGKAGKSRQEAKEKSWGRLQYEP